MFLLESRIPRYTSTKRPTWVTWRYWDMPPLPPCAFPIKLNGPLPGPSQSTVFQEALYNHQNHSDLATGVCSSFSCTTPSVHHFGSDIALFQNAVKVGLVRNGIQVRNKQGEAKDSHEQVSGSSITQLRRGIWCGHSLSWTKRSLKKELLWLYSMGIYSVEIQKAGTNSTGLFLKYLCT